MKQLKQHPPGSDPGRRPHYRLKRDDLFLIVVSVSTLALCLSLALRILPTGIPGEWIWDYAQTPLPQGAVSLLPPIIYFLLFAGVLFLFLRVYEKDRKGIEFLAILAIFIFALIFQFVFAELEGGGLQKSLLIIMSPSTTGYYSYARDNVKDSPLNFLKNFEDTLRQTHQGRIAIHPPGLIFFYASSIKAFERWPWLAHWVLVAVGKDLQYVFDALEEAKHVRINEVHRATLWIWAILPRFLAALTVVPLYLLARRLYRRKTALLAASLFALVPSIILFSPKFDTIYPLFAILVFYISDVALEKKTLPLSLLAGVMLCLGMFFSLCFLALIALLGVWGVGRMLTGEKASRASPARLLKWAIGLGVGFISVVLIFYLFFNCSLVHIWWLVYRNLHEYDKGFLERTHLLWALYNPIDFFTFLGLPVAALFFRRLLYIGRNWRGIRELASGDLLAICFTSVFLLLLASGAVNGEVARLWAFLMPFAVIAGASAITRRGRIGGRFFFILLALQMTQGIFYRVYLDVLQPR